MNWPWSKNKVYDAIIKEMVDKEDADAKKIFRENRYRNYNVNGIGYTQAIIEDCLRENRIRDSGAPITKLWKKLNLWEKIVLGTLQLLSINLVISLIAITTNVMWEYIFAITGILFIICLVLWLLKNSYK